MTTRGIIFDGDDTLWETMPLYTEAKHRFYEFMESQGFDRSIVSTEFERTDLANLATMGFARERFPKSMVDTLRTFLTTGGIEPSPAAVDTVRLIGERVFDGDPPLMPDAHQVLAELANEYRLVLATKGDAEVQHRRVQASGLKGFFEAVYVLPSKDRGTFSRIIEESNLLASDSWSVGNSLRSDINPALRVGLGAIWIPYYTWDAETDEEIAAPRLHKADRLSDCLKVLLQGNE